MRISRDNYEIWLTDWLENKLSGEQLQELKMFLRENPDLEKEFNSISELSLSGHTEVFHWKGLLKRDISEIPPDQFDLLCAANIEGDLDADHLSELSEILAGDPEKKRTADLFTLTKLNLVRYAYPHKNKLYRRPMAAAVARFAIPAISAAALLAVLLMTGVLRKGIVPVEITNQAAAQYFEIQRSAPVRAPVNLPAPDRSNPSKNIPAQVRNASVETTRTVQSSPTRNETVTLSAEVMDIPRVKTDAVLRFGYLNSNLAVGPAYIPQQAVEDDEERSRIGKFLARAFREKVLEEPAASDKPLKGYEIAEAGITGINKLLGWEMALTRNTDGAGRTSSVNFNSRLLKFNAPVKNNDAGE